MFPASLDSFFSRFLLLDELAVEVAADMAKSLDMHDVSAPGCTHSQRR